MSHLPCWISITVSIWNTLWLELLCVSWTPNKTPASGPSDAFAVFQVIQSDTRFCVVQNQMWDFKIKVIKDGERKEETDQKLHSRHKHSLFLWGLLCVLKPAWFVCHYCQFYMQKQLSSKYSWIIWWGMKALMYLSKHRSQPESDSNICSTDEFGWNFILTNESQWKAFII